MKNVVQVKNIKIGGGAPVSVQSMTNTPTSDAAATLAQVRALSAAGCDIVRVAVTNAAEADACAALIKESPAPLVADIQFDYRLAVRCADIGFNKIRFNPGNIGSEKNVAELVSACKANGVPIRVGVNGGSLEKDILNEFGGATAEALVKSALRHAAILEKSGFYNTVLSVKSSSVKTTIAANRLLDKACDYPLHIGVTESGAFDEGLAKSAVGIGALLLDGIGDTVRVSLSGDPVKEVAAATSILRAADLGGDYCEIVSCPTCSRCKYDMMSVLQAVRAETAGIKKRLKIAVMGCAVNGPGEARDADIGVAGGEGRAAVFKNGKVLFTTDFDGVIPALKKLIAEFTD
ncbi:MAG: flavodoxin-dependent (E)-4-hydroxy-3-methylbut-2-enyl-diphosphate synthase [Clostridiales bacterium]|jgi:(E)-4-hydroxy-3-methylbut-2-enyl-diphosphate synthase|nr:flavodoxin-dependent (E)-4-hydroxy-3-methylbut-2-enyl-diphosphate synthase [Clostridiales bacterium]